LKTFDATHKIFKLFFGTKKNKKSIQKIDTLFYPHTRLKRALIGWLPQSYTSLSLRRLLLLLLHREEARSGVE